MEETEKLITVTGKGSVHVLPDVTRLHVSLVSIHDTYDEAYAQAKSNTDSLTKIMNEVGIDPKRPKTISLDIEKKTKSEYDRYNNFKGEKFLGFQLDHEVKIDLGMDNVLLNKIIKLIGQHLKQAEIEIGYTVKDPRPTQLKMLERAVKDAKEKATIMAKACGCKLGLVKNIDYSEHELHIYSQARQFHDADEACGSTPESLDITPDDLSVSDGVTCVWYLSNDVHKDND